MCARACVNVGCWDVYVCVCRMLGCACVCWAECMCVCACVCDISIKGEGICVFVSRDMTVDKKTNI